MDERQPPEDLAHFMASSTEAWNTGDLDRIPGASAIPCVVVIGFRDGRIWRDTRWFGDPFEAPAWRAQWVERMEEAPAPDGTCP